MINMKIFNTIRRIIGRLGRSWEDPHYLLPAKALMLADNYKTYNPNNFPYDKEFRVFSQFGDDGIIQFLILFLPLDVSAFIEFGCADYFESNTHFLLVNNNWIGFVIDGSSDNINTIRRSPLYWRYTLTAKHSFITRENINKLLAESGFERIGLLHIDLDGNDFWVLQAVDLDRYAPDILILEYNSVFGSERSITVPYDPEFERFRAHYTGLYWGASLAALAAAVKPRGYFLVCSNTAGNNAYFLHERHAGRVEERSVAEAYRESRYRESRDRRGRLDFLSGTDRYAAIRGLPVVNTLNERIEPL